MTISVLLADDDSALRLVLQQAFAREAFQVRATATLSALVKWAKEGEGDVIVSDVYLGDDCLFDVLPSLRLARPDLPVIVMSGQNHVLTALSAAETGAYEYLPKPFDLDRLIAATRRATIGKPDAKTRAAQNAAERDARLPLIGRSAAMQEVYRVLSRVAGTDLNVVVEGETGVGKQRIARAIHDHSRRRERPFTRLGLAGADGDVVNALVRQSHDVLAENGSVLLDDVGEATPSGQAALQRILEDGALGKARIIATSAIPLEAHPDTFRRDLFYRLAQVTLRAPPLRERREDIPDLARALLVHAARQGLPERALDQAGADALSAHDWPGNVRELENVLRRLAVLRPETLISLRDIEMELAAQRRAAAVGPLQEMSFEDLIAKRLAQEYANGLPDNLYDTALATFERPLLALALKATDGSQIRAAAILGINRNTLRKKMQLLGLGTARQD
jgi:two-component system nitrogen regulation response regulator GlnG